MPGRFAEAVEKTEELVSLPWGIAIHFASVLALGTRVSGLVIEWQSPVPVGSLLGGIVVWTCD